jgi:hypothetical protein
MNHQPEQSLPVSQHRIILFAQVLAHGVRRHGFEIRLVPEAAMAPRAAM